MLLSLSEVQRSQMKIKIIAGPKPWGYCEGSQVNNVIILRTGTSLVVQWLRIRLPMQGTQVRSLVREDPTCRGATKLVHHNC